MSDWRVLSVIWLTAAATTAPRFTQQAATGNAARPPCTVSSPVVRVAGLPEGSGVAASRRTPGVLWAHNDSGDPVILALDTGGAVVGSVRVEGASVDDWEDIAVGPCGQTTCVYVADIGDNSGKRRRISVYRVPEPSPGAARTDPADVFHATYPDGAHDAEALFVAPDSTVFVLTKGDPGPVALYRFPNPLNSQAPMRLERVGEARGTARVDAKDRPTGADASSDGRWVAVRTTHWVEFHRAPDLTSGRWRAAARADLSGLGERRGEGVALGSGDSVFLVGEGGGSHGTFARLRCALPPG